MVLVLISGYGLRIGEAACLRLEDLDCQARRLRVRRNKTQSETIFPTTTALEEGWAAYLEVRPATPHRVATPSMVTSATAVRADWACAHRTVTEASRAPR